MMIRNNNWIGVAYQQQAALNVVASGYAYLPSLTPTLMRLKCGVLTMLSVICVVLNLQHLAQLTILITNNQRLTNTNLYSYETLTLNKVCHTFV